MFRSIKRVEDQAETGFTMIEALVALSVAAISLVAIGAVVAGSVRGTITVDQRVALIQTARAALTGLPDRDQLAPGDFRGEIGDHDWRVDVMPFAANFVDPSQPTPWVPEAVVVRVATPTGEILRLDTVRLRRQGTQE